MQANPSVRTTPDRRPGRRNPRLPRLARHVLLAGAIALGAAGCTPPEQPPVDEPPEPQATQLRDAIQAPIEQARAVEDTVAAAAEARRRQVDAAAD